MDRNTVSAAALLVTALVLNQHAPVQGADHASPAPLQAQVHVQDAQRAPRASQSSRQKCPAGDKCDALMPYGETGPWAASCAWFDSQGQTGQEPGRAESVALTNSDPETIGYYRDNWCVGGAYAALRPKFLIVTVPDPVATHLALYFDRALASVEAAVQQYKLYLARYWLPWRPGNDAIAPGDVSSELRVNRILEDFRSAQPGLMIFIAPPGGSLLCGNDSTPKVPCALYVFLVSESPTAGINRSEFKNAVRYACVLNSTAGQPCDPCKPPPHLHVIGPFFSGSTPSVIELNRELHAAGQNLDFVSGAMTGGSQRDILRNSGLDFDQTLHDEALARRFFLQFLRSQHMTKDASNVAILREDETSYGGGTETQGKLETDALAERVAMDDRSFDGLHTITFPRELSRLRNASADDFGASVVPVPSGEKHSPTEALLWNWRDVGRGQDSVPAFSGSQEPLSQQAIMLAISDVIRREKIQYVGVAATDIFDILFLSRFLKFAAPNTRLFLLDADLLMVRTSDVGRELNGTLVVTSHPLIDRIDGASAHSTKGHAPFQPSMYTFSSRAAEGVYNAVLVQLNRQDSDGLGGNSEHSWRSSFVAHSSIANERLPLWLTMVGRTDFWPISALSSPINTNASADPTGYRALSRSTHARLTIVSPDNTTLLFLGAVLLWGIIHLVGMVGASVTEYPWLAQFEVRAPEDRRQYAQHQNYYLICATLALSTMLELIAICIGWLWYNGAIPSFRPLLAWILYGCVALVGVALFLAAIRVAARTNFRLLRPRPYLYVPWVLHFGSVSVWCYLGSGETATAVFFAERSLFLSNGVSPLLPVLLLSLMYYWWAWIFVRKVRLSESKQVHVPELSKLGPAGCGLENCIAKLRKGTDRLVFHPRLAWWIGGGFTAVVGLLLRPWEALRSVEGRAYDVFFICLVLWVCLLVILVWGRYLYIWSKLRRILRGLERTPLRNAFTRLPKKTYSWSPLWYEDAERRAYTISARSVECFQALVKLNGFGEGDLMRLEQMVDDFTRVVDSKRRAPVAGTDERCRAVARLQQLFQDTAEKLLEHSLRARWAEGGSDTLAELEGWCHKAALTNEQRVQMLQEEFVALRYVGLIHYESAQLKNLAVLLVVGFVLALASIGSYPFLAGRQWVWILAGVFVVFGAGIVMSFAQMARDSMLSRLSGTDPGKLDLSFYVRVLSYGALPLLALLASQFPSVGSSLFSWVQPALNAMH